MLASIQTRIENMYGGMPLKQGPVTSLSHPQSCITILVVTNWVFPSVQAVDYL